MVIFLIDVAALFCLTDIKPSDVKMTYRVTVCDARQLSRVCHKNKKKIASRRDGNKKMNQFDEQNDALMSSFL